MKTQPKFEIGQKVQVTTLHEPMFFIVVGFVECVAGYKYQLAFETKKGAIDKRRSHRFFFEIEIIHRDQITKR